MKKYFLSLVSLVFLLGGLTSCESDDTEFGDRLRDNRPAIPVNFPGTTTFAFDPFIEIVISDSNSTVSLDSTIRFVLEVPEASGVDIVSILGVAAGGTGINPGTPRTYLLPEGTIIPGNGRTAVFETTVSEFLVRRPAPGVPASATRPGGEIAFIFRVLLSNGEEITTRRVRVRFLSRD